MRRGIAMLVLVSAAACGYAVIRADAPFGAARIAVLPFREETPVGLSAELAHALAELLANDGVRLVADADSADAVLSGAILVASTTKSPVAAVDATIPAYQIDVQIQAELIRQGKPVWSTTLSSREAFLTAGSDEGPATQTLATESNRRLALTRLAQSLARSLHDELVMDSTARARR